MKSLYGVRLAKHCKFAVALCLWSTLAGATDVGLAGIMSGKALLTVNGGAPEMVTVGQMTSGVRLLSVQGDEVLVEVEGKKRSLRIGQHAMGQAVSGGGDKVVLVADGAGHFFTTGAVNGVAVRFLVDTGATLISLGSSDAQRIGIDAAKGRRAVSNTANGAVQVSVVKLDTVRVGDITLYNVDASVHQRDMPIALLGMSFLNRMDMRREDSTMTLKKRF